MHANVKKHLRFLFLSFYDSYRVIEVPQVNNLNQVTLNSQILQSSMPTFMCTGAKPGQKGPWKPLDRIFSKEILLAMSKVSRIWFL